VPQHETSATRRSPPIFALHDFDSGAADSDRDGFHEDRTLAFIRLRNLFQKCTAPFFGSTVIAFIFLVCDLWVVGFDPRIFVFWGAYTL
jgi:hypothetical protein